MLRPARLAPVLLASFLAPAIAPAARAEPPGKPSSPAPPSSSSAPTHAAPTDADISGTDRIVRLKGGALYRGELVELVPDSHLVLKLATGEIKRFAWGDIAREGEATRPASPAPTASAPAVSAAASSAASSAPTTGAPFVGPVAPPTSPPSALRILVKDSPAGTTLERRVDSQGGSKDEPRWEEVCRAPCGNDVAVAPAFRLRVGETTSDPFIFTGVSESTRERTLRLRSEPRGTGWVVAGVVTLVGGLVLGGLSMVTEVGDIDTRKGLGGGGVAVGLGGIFMIVYGAFQVRHPKLTVESEAPLTGSRPAREAHAVTLPRATEVRPAFVLGPSGFSF